MDPEMLKAALMGAQDHYGNQMAGGFKQQVAPPEMGMGGDDLSKEQTVSAANEPGPDEMSPEIMQMLLDQGGDPDVDSPPPSDGLDEMSLQELLNKQVPR